VTIYFVRIDPDGSIIEFEHPDVLGEASREFDGLTSVVTLRSWFYDDRTDDTGMTPVLVGVIHDWGRTNHMPLNVKAWALYARSPLCGPVYVGNDGSTTRPPLHPQLLAALRNPAFPFIPPAPGNLATMLRTALSEAVAAGEADVPDAGPLDDLSADVT
jgi:hypothetical protein